MKHVIRQKIKSTSKAIYIALFALAGILLVGAVFSVSATPGRYLAMRLGTYTPLEFQLDIVAIGRLCCLVALLVVMAFIFRKISVNETPFLKTIPKRLKIVSLLVFVSIAVPQWLGYVFYSISTGEVSFSVFDNLTISAVIISGLVFCFAQIFDYGYMIQDENDEIL